MNPYADLDPILNARAKTAGWVVFTEWADAPARFFHIGGDAPHDAFQVSIEPPRGGQVTVFARSIDTNDDLELEQSWTAETDRFDALLTAAVQKIEQWKLRAP